MTISVAGLLAAIATGSPAAAPIPRLDCARPAALRLLRFEDGSAQLRCGGALLARVSSPG